MGSYILDLISTGKDVTFDYISVTPPYMLVDYAVLMDQVSNSSIIGENTFIVSWNWNHFTGYHYYVLLVNINFYLTSPGSRVPFEN